MLEEDDGIPVREVMNANSSAPLKPPPRGDVTHLMVAVRCRPLFENEKQIAGHYTRTTILRIQDNMIFLQDPFEGIDSKVERSR